MSTKTKVEVINFQLFDVGTEAKLSIARNLFAQKDTKGEGYLEPEVASQLVQQVFTQSGTSGFKPSPDDVRAFMIQIKSIRKLEITYYEFESYFLSCLARAGHKIKPENTILRTNRKFNPLVEIQLNVARKQFAKFDTDKSGSLDSKEVYNLIAQTHQLIGMEKDTPSEEDVKYYIELADSDKDGLISIQEYEDLFLMNLKKKGAVVIQYKVVNNAETCEKVEEEVKEVEKVKEQEKPNQSGQSQVPPVFIIKNVYHDDAETKLNAARKLFIERDVDKSGRLDQNEVANLISTTFANTGVQNYNPTAEDVKLYMDAVDTNKDGLVSYEEYERYVIYCLQKAGVNCSIKSNFIKSRRSFNPEIDMQLDQARKFFAQLDTDRSGFLEENEIYGLIAFTHKEIGMNTKPTAEEVQKYIQQADTNHDGKISIQEYEDLVLQNYRQTGIVVIEYSIPEVTVIEEVRNEGNVSVHSQITVTKVTTVTTRTVHQSVHTSKHVENPITESKVLTSTHTSTTHQSSQITDSKQLDEPLNETKKFTNEDGGVQEEREPIRLVESMIRNPDEQSKIVEEQVPKSFDELNVIVRNDNQQPDLSSSDEEEQQKQKSNNSSDDEKEKNKPTKDCDGEKEKEKSNNSSDDEKEKNKPIKDCDDEKQKKKDKKGKKGSRSNSRSSSSSSSSDEEEEQKVKRNKKPQNQQDDGCDLDDDEEAEGKKIESQKPYVKEVHRQNLALIGLKHVYVPQIEARLDAARRLFIKHDVNKSGSLDADEAANLITSFFAEHGIEGYRPTAEDVRIYMDEVDTNKDGLIQYLEYESYVIKCLEKVGVQCEVLEIIVKSNRRFNPEAEIQLDIARRQFTRFDTDKSGYLEEGEIYGLIRESYAEMGIVDYQPTEEDVKYYIQLADTDNDGKISIIEFEDLIILSLKQSGMQVIQYRQLSNPKNEEGQEAVKRTSANEGFRRGRPVQHAEEQAQEEEKNDEQEPECKQVVEAAEQTKEPPREPAGKHVVEPQVMEQSTRVVIIEVNERVVIEPVNVEEEEEKPKKQSLPSIVIKKVYDNDIEEKLQIARKLFIQSDKDQNGELDPMEVATLIENTFASAGIKGYQPTIGEVKDYIDAVDTDKNGLLSYEEYENYVISCFEKAGLKCDVKDTILKSNRRFNPQVELKLDVARRLFAKYDTDRSGELEENEIYGIISDTYRSIGINDFRPTVDDVRMWLEMADSDQNGSVSIYEYENLILTSLEKAGIEIKRFSTIN